MNLLSDVIKFPEWDDEIIAVVCKYCREMVLAGPADYAVKVALAHGEICQGNELRMIECIPPRNKTPKPVLPKIQ